VSAGAAVAAGRRHRRSGVP